MDPFPLINQERKKGNTLFNQGEKRLNTTDSVYAFTSFKNLIDSQAPILSPKSSSNHILPSKWSVVASNEMDIIICSVIFQAYGKLFPGNRVDCFLDV